MKMVEVSKQAEIQRWCPLVDVRLYLLAGPPETVLIIGYRGETDEQLVRAESTSLAKAERDFKEAYAKACAGGLIGRVHAVQA